MNKIKLKYLRWKNTSDWVFKRKHKNTTIENIYYSIKPTNTHPGWRKNFFVIYKASKLQPDSKFLKQMVTDTFLHLRETKNEWRFAKHIYKEIQKRLKEIG